MADWEPALYLRYGEYRTRPAADLAAAIPAVEARRILDLGCGPGNSTAAAAARWPEADVLGVDASEEMLADARRAHPQFRFARCVLPEGLNALGGGWDVIFSNACLHWVPGHETLIPALFALLAPGGVLAVQMPLTMRQPVHALLAQIAAAPRWRLHVAQGARHALAPEEYYDLLCRLPGRFSLWQTEYCQPMPSHEAILEWYRGAALRPYLAALAEDARPAFEREVLAGIRKLYPPRADGSIAFPMPRLFFTVQKGAV